MLNHGLPGVPTPDQLSPAVRETMPPGITRPQDEASVLRAAAVLVASVLNVVVDLGAVVRVDQMAEAIGAICRRASSHGVPVTIEFLPESGVPNLNHALRLIEVCGEPAAA